MEPNSTQEPGIMASITVKNIPEPLMRRLRLAAAHANRSLNRQIIDCLERQLLPESVDVEAALHRIRELRARGPARVTLGELREARRRGRP